MNNNDIIRALECCMKSDSEDACFGCPAIKTSLCCFGSNKISYGILCEVLNLIKLLQAENNELKNEIAIANKLLEDYHVTVDGLGKLNELTRSTAVITPNNYNFEVGM